MDYHSDRETILTAVKNSVSVLQSSELQLTDLEISKNVFDLAELFVQKVTFGSRYGQPKVFTTLLPLCNQISLIDAIPEVMNWQQGLKALLRYPINLLLAPNRPELKRVKVSTSYYVFHVQRKLKVAETFLNLMGYLKLQGSSDLILRKLSQEDLYSIVADIVILHEDLKIILFLLDRVNKFSRTLTGVPIEFKHVMLARKLGPPKKHPCLDFIMNGHVVSSDHSQISEQRPLTPSSKNYDILGLQLDDSPSSSFELPPPIMTQSQLQYMMRGRESSYPSNNSPFDREEVILPTQTKSGSYPNTVQLSERENSFEKTPFTASMLRRHSDSSGSSGTSSTSWGQTSFTRNLYNPFKQSESSPMFKIGVEDSPYNERTSPPLSRQGRVPLLHKGLSVGSSMSDSAYYSTQPSSQYPSNQYGTYQYDSQYNQPTNQYGSQYDSRYSNQYDSHYGNQLSNTYNYPLNSRDNLTLKQNKEPTIRKYVNVDIDEVVQEVMKGIALQFNSSSQSTHHGLLKGHSIDSLMDMQAHGTLDSSPPQSTNNRFHVQQRSHSASSLMEPAIQYPSGHHTVSSLPRPSTPSPTPYKISPRPSTTCKSSPSLMSKVGAQQWTCYFCMNENYNTNKCDVCNETCEEFIKQEREFENEQMKLQEKNLQLQTLIDSLQFEKKSLQKEKEHLKIQKHSFEIQIQQLDKEKQHLQREVTDLQASYTQLQRDKDQLEFELQGQITRLTLEQKGQHDYCSWEVSHKEVTLTKEKLGKGAWGAIWIGIFREQRVAVKQMHEIIINEDTLQLLHREINTMAQLRHPNLLQFIGAVLDDPSGNPMIITEIMDTSLCNAYETKQLTPHPSCESVMLTIIRDVAVGLNYLHCLPDPIIHRDVSSANVLLESKGPHKWKTKISDFGSANKARKAKTRGAGALVYGAPESVPSLVKVQKAQTTKMDVFSYGVLFCEVLTCCFPSDLPIFQEMLQKVHSRSPSLHDLIVSCIKEDPSSRPIMKQVIECLDIYRQNTSIQSDQTN